MDKTGVVFLQPRNRKEVEFTDKELALIEDYKAGKIDRADIMAATGWSEGQCKYRLRKLHVNTRNMRKSKLENNPQLPALARQWNNSHITAIEAATLLKVPLSSFKEMAKTYLVNNGIPIRTRKGPRDQAPPKIPHTHREELPEYARWLMVPIQITGPAAETSARYTCPTCGKVFILGRCGMATYGRYRKFVVACNATHLNAERARLCIKWAELEKRLAP